MNAPVILRTDYRSDCEGVNEKLKTAKSQYYHDKLAGTPDQKYIYKIKNSLLFGTVDKKLPSHESVSELAEHFANYFSDKITAILNTLCCDISDVSNEVTELKTHN